MVKGGNTRFDEFKEGVGNYANNAADGFRKGSKYAFKEKKYTGDFLRDKKGELILNGKDPIREVDLNNYDISGLTPFAREKYDKLKTNLDRQKFILDEDRGAKRKYKDYNGVRVKTIVVLGLLALGYLMISALVADIYNNSGKKITEDETAQRAYAYVVSSMTASITIVITLTFAAMMKEYKLAWFLILFGIFGIATSAIGIHWINNDPDMSKTYSKDKWKFLIAAIVIWIFVIFAALVSLAL
jgi:hypothetical protein